ncbi:hypothetical protein GCM10023189_05910 [Nibrella saemangeumensis]|uniref:ParE-like toxin domain-containing protein n=1 Tax=Nibrella saemangeumensis TaxID=1084526 RepID=A0ABP8MEC8_9BACT
MPHSVTTQRFRECYAKLPEHIQEATRKAYYLWKEDPSHPAIQFKQVHTTRPIYSARVSLAFRALGIRQDNTIIWFWVGSHADYDRLLKVL